MFHLFKPSCPCDPEAKKWVESRLQWLSRQFGLHILLERPILLPTPEFFPDPWESESEESARLLFNRVCDYMGVDEEDVELEIFDDRESYQRSMIDPTAGFAAGTWSPGEEAWHKGLVRLERSSLHRPGDLIAILAHELSHQRLLGENRIDDDAFDNELLTDLTAIYHGFGVFLANHQTKRSLGEIETWPGTSLRKPEYISEPIAGYALAHMAWFRDEAKPEWARHLRWVGRGAFKQGLRYLTETGDSSFKPERLR